MLTFTLIASLSMVQHAQAHEEPSAPTDQVQLGLPAIDFELTDQNGKTSKLSDYKGKTVVLEWFNPGCPFVVYAHKEGPLKNMASKAMNDGVVWLAINSSAPGKQGHGLEANQKAAKDWNMEHPILFDEKGVVGRLYGAVTTPQMFVVDAKGILVYEGALDNAPRGQAPASGQVDHISNALADLKAGKAVKTSRSRPYGCSVKY